MAFPVVVTADSKSGNGNAGSYNAPFPDNLVLGDLVLFLHANRGRHTITLPGSPWVGFTRAQGGGGGSGAQQSIGWAKKVSDGTESGGTFTVSFTGGPDNYVYYSMRITGWEGTLGSTFDNSGTAGAVEMNYAEGNDSNPNPPNLDPNNWGIEDTLWLAMTCRREFTFGLNSYPTGFGLYQSDIVTSDIRFDRCGIEDAVSSKDPAVFACQGGDDWMTTTIAIRPAAPIIPPVIRVPIPQVSQAGGMRW